MPEIEQTFHEPDEDGNVVDKTHVSLAADRPDPHEDPEHPAVGNDTASVGEQLSGTGDVPASPAGQEQGRQG